MSISVSKDGTIVATGTGVTIYQALSIKQGLKTWAKYKVRLNSAWTPRAMMKTVERITGETFKARDYAGAIKALEKWIDEAKLQERIQS